MTARRNQYLSENEVTGVVRRDADKHHCTLFRNNSGAYKDKKGRLVRYGLCNESKKQNENMKSSDLIGFRSVIITPDMVGKMFAQFVCREVKDSDWTYTGDAHEEAQARFIQMVNEAGGDGAFATGEGTFHPTAIASRAQRMTPAERRADIIKKTAQAIVDCGGVTFKFDDVSRVAGMTTAGIRNYFRSMRELIDTVSDYATTAELRKMCEDWLSKQK